MIHEIGKPHEAGRRLSEGLLFLVTVVWGSTFIVMKNVSDAVSPSGFVFLRFLLATVGCGLLFHRHLTNLSKKTIRKGIFIGFFLFLGILMQVWGLKYTSSSNSAFLTGLIVITVPLLHSILERKSPRAGVILGAFFAMGGLLLLSGAVSGDGFHALNLGDLLTLVGTVAWTIEVVAIDRLVRDEDPYALSFLQFLTVTVLSGALWLVLGDLTLVIAPPLVLAVLYTGIAGTFLAFTVQTVFQFRTSPSKAVLIYSFEPVVALLLALVIPGPDGHPESLGLIRAMGCLLVFIGMLSAEFLPLRSRKDS